MSQTQISGIISNGAVLQRDRINLIKGIEPTLSKISAVLTGPQNRIELTADVTNKRFAIELPPIPSGTDFTLTVRGSSEITVSDLCFGDVFMLCGQSNMELPVYRTMDVNEAEINAADYPLIRQYKLNPDFNNVDTSSLSDTKLDSLCGPEGTICRLADTPWIKAAADTKGQISAVGFYAAKRIFERTGVPIGLILNAQGGSSIESWMAPSDLATVGIDRSVYSEFDGLDTIKNYLAEGNDKTITWRSATVPSTPVCTATSIPADASEVTMPSLCIENYSGSLWLYKEFDLDALPTGDSFLYLGEMIDADETFINGISVGHTEYQYPPRKYHFDSSVLRAGKNLIAVRLLIEHNMGGFVPGHPYFLRTSLGELTLSGTWKLCYETSMPEFNGNLMGQVIPTALYNTSILPIASTQISAIWWYQGESNGDRPEQYDLKEKLLFERFRSHFGSETPITVVEMADYINPLTKATEVPSGWREIQRLQREAATLLPGITVVSASQPVPIVYELHSQNKSPLGAAIANSFLGE